MKVLNVVNGYDLLEEKEEPWSETDVQCLPRDGDWSRLYRTGGGLLMNGGGMKVTQYLCVNERKKQ